MHYIKEKEVNNTIDKEFYRNVFLSGKEALDIESKNCCSGINDLPYHYSLKIYIFLNIFSTFSKLKLEGNPFF